MTDKLILHIQIDDIDMDDWREGVEDYKTVIDESFEEALLQSVLHELAHEQVHVVLRGVPGEKQLNDDWEVNVKPGHIVGAELVEGE